MGKTIATKLAESISPKCGNDNGGKIDADGRCELLQWVANGKTLIDGEIFVEGNRSAEPLQGHFAGAQK